MSFGCYHFLPHSPEKIEIQKNKTGLLTHASLSLNPSRIITSSKEETTLYSGSCLARQHLQLRGQYRILIDFPIKRLYASYSSANTIY